MQAPTVRNEIRYMQNREQMTTAALFTEVEFEEGLRLKPYRDKMGIWSIGIGHNLEADPTLHAQLQHLIQVGITEDFARKLFASDVQKAENDLDLHIPWWRQMDDVRQDAVVSLCFNLGCGKLLTFHHTIDALHAKQYAQAGRYLLQTKPWADQVPERAKRLSAQIATGIPQYN